ncbi:hypothetical protein BAE44_0020602 [Dichanthelium oligosanthes]|uniref:PHF5-like protein n=1 Tax=Dichanthelium oligosanthes TaxID=888268 RepID=A0A1E5UZQ9_9POAL|nr:hypothetical protein BAE44_0020602 [Dichanthelium oligosanthes]
MAAAWPATPWCGPARWPCVCDGCGYGAGGGSGRERCVVCSVRGGGGAVADAYYCKACVQMEKDRDGCPAVVNAGMAVIDDSFYQRKKHVQFNARTTRLIYD